MDEEKILIIANGKDKTKKIEMLSKNDNGKINIKYYNKDTIYQYKPNNIIIKEQSVEMDLKEKDIYYKNQILFNIKKVIKFEEFIKVVYENEKTEVFRYNELDSEIIESQIVSVFDLLYKEYSKKLEKLNSKLLNRSKFKSENIMDTILNNELKKEDYRDYKYEREIVLRNVFKSLDNLSEEEKEYINNGARVDFVIYDKMNNEPKLFIEVDGFEYHKNNPNQLNKDILKDSIARKNGISLLRFETGGKSYNEEKIVIAIKEKL